MADERVSKEVDVDICSLDELRALVREQQQVIARLERDLRAARTQINRLQDQTQRHPTERLDQEYSVEAEEKRKQGGCPFPYSDRICGPLWPNCHRSGKCCWHREFGKTVAFGSRPA